jgi:DNA-binding transcriptional regulator YiaG
MRSTEIVDVDENICLAYMGCMSPEQCRAARGWLDLSQEDLAKAATVSLSTVRDYEKGRRVPIANNLAAIQAALEKAGIAFEGTSGITFAKPSVRSKRG